jgi:hypothetical protein
MATVQNNDAINNSAALEQSLNDVPTTYEFVYFQPTPSYIGTADLKTCYNSNYNGSMKKIGDVLGSTNVMHTRDTCKFNAGMIQNKKRMKDQEIIKNANKTPGLSYKIVNGYFNDDPNYFLNTTILSNGKSNDFKNISGSTNNMLINNDVPDSTNVSSVEWYGYFIPSIKGDWTFGVTSSDSCLLWIGTNAESDYNKTNTYVSNGGLHDVKYTEKSNNFKKNATYPIRIQYGHHSSNYNFQLIIKDPKGIDVTNSVLFMIKKLDGSIYAPSLTYYSLVERDTIDTQAGLFDCYVSDNVSNMIQDTSGGCSGSSQDSNGNFIYTTAKNWKNGQRYYPYRIHADQHLDNLYLANVKDKTFMNIKKDTSTTLSNNFIFYKNFYPEPTDIKNANKVNSLKEAEQSCINDSSCKYFYYYKDKNNNNYCIKKSDSYVPNQFIPQQLNENIKSSELYIRNLTMNITDNVRSKIPRKNVLDYKAYTDYEIIPDQFDVVDKYSGLSSDLVNQLKKHSAYYENFTTKEGFDEHGYSKPNNVAQEVTSGQNSNYIDQVKDKQVTPLQEITKDYVSTITQITQKYNDIGSKINSVNSNVTTLSSDVDNKYDFNGDTLPYYNGAGGCNGIDKNGKSVIKPCGTKVPTSKDAMGEDIKAIILQQNTIYTLGSITAASLLILAIFLAK